MTRCGPRFHISPGLEMAGPAGNGGASSAGSSPWLALAMMRSISTVSNPVMETSRSICRSARNSSSVASSFSSHPALRAILLSASASARRSASESPAMTMTGTTSRPILMAAARRAWPAIITPCSSISSGLVKPNRSIDAPTWAICLSSWVRAFFGSVERLSTRRWDSSSARGANGRLAPRSSGPDRLRFS